MTKMSTTLTTTDTMASHAGTLPLSRRRNTR